ncbi:hypothetical protein HYH03_007317 [Edaphochlamys debaryana]|uniref:Uncharacterized protein n=1 Tax=Edaphochlamys debaryana TaxID=47281 RepID=A0A835Y270_9CHLO|nr:hypothetical protein HYH03_007317 [Edaphochlamys debaryana]|eukprot:KAG2494550.1 hypothetical protein HYH03_007317 [Edaphochlamys debaryana]
MPRALLEARAVADVATNSGAGYALVVGLICGFVLGLASFGIISCFGGRRKKQLPPARVQEVRASVNRGEPDYSSVVVIPTRPGVSTSVAGALPPSQPLPPESYYSPLAASMTKTMNLRASMNAFQDMRASSALQDVRAQEAKAGRSVAHDMPPEAAAMLGGHGFAVVQISRPAPAAPPPATPAQAPVPAAPGTPEPAPAQLPDPEAAAPQPEPQPQAQPQLQPSTRHNHARMHSVAEAYVEEDLDPEWMVVLGDLEGVLAKKGHAGLNPPERAVAVRKLVQLTGSRGLKYALEAAAQDVLQFRRVVPR